MEKYTITKESVLALAATSQTARLILTENFPDAFKEEMVIGKWYKGIRHNFLVNYQGNDAINYGFWGNLPFKNDIFFGDYWVDECREATDEEVEIALIAEAKKRGYKKGEWCKFGNSGMIRKLDSDYIKWIEDWGGIGIGGLSIGCDIIFSDGEWAEIVTKNIKEITMHKAVKILSKKYGKKVTIK